VTQPALSQIGTQMSQLTGVRAIMKDIIETLRAGGERAFLNLSAGNPTLLPSVERLWRDCTQELLASSEYGRVVSRYGSSRGYEPFIEAIASDFNERYGLELSERNLLVTPGSQSLYFYIANAFGGRAPDGTCRQILLPLSPEYTGYGGVSLDPDAAIAHPPDLDLDDRAHRFKYRPNFERLPLSERTGCLMLSRPCNPTGNVVTDAEVQQLAALAADRQIPLAIDAAYSPPYPALNFGDLAPQFGSSIIHCLSLSKAGLPGERLGVAITDPALIDVLEAFQPNLCIHSSRYGQAIAARAIASGRLSEIAETVIRPHYRDKFAVLETALSDFMPDDLPWYLHRGEGGIFAWLWFRDLPVSDWELYQWLKAENVIAVPGSTFFPGLREPWDHARQCLRLSLTATAAEIAEAIRRLSGVVADLYRPVAV